jgi:glutaminyl-peptide cyclotransferase
MSRRTELIAGGVGLLIAAGAAGFFLIDRGSSAGTSPTRPLSLGDDADDPPRRDKFGEDRVPANADLKKIPVDGERAVKYIKQLCDIGPRVSGTEGMAKQQALLIKHFEDLGAKVTKQEFKARQRSQRTDVAMTNLIVSYFPDRKSRVIFCSHYDSRPAAHEEANPANWRKPFDSANDGTSGVALFMELAHHMKDFPTGVGVDFVLFDGEEYIFDPGTPGLGNGDKFFFGSEHFGAEYAKNKAKLPYKYEAAILLDLFGHADARLAVEGHSWKYAQKLVTEVWSAAAGVGAKSFKKELGFQRAENVLDDHIALNEAGIPAIDIIDFDYKHWHLLSDTVDKCSPKQLAEVGTVLTAWLQTRK